MAPLGPAPEMVSKLRSRSLPVSWRSACSRSEASISPSLPLGASRRQPGQEAADRGAVAAMGARGCPPARPRSCRPWAAPRDRPRAPAAAPRGLQAVRRPHRRARRSTSTRLPARPSRSSAAPSSSGGATVTALPSQRQGAVGQLAAVDEEIDVPSACSSAKPSGERRARHVAAADVEQPGDRNRGR